MLCVDWASGAIFPNYVRAVANTRLVGRQLSLLLGSLKERLGLDLAKVHLIGFSLGAHVAAFAGAELGSVHRITGMLSDLRQPQLLLYCDQQYYTAAVLFLLLKTPLKPHLFSYSSSLLFSVHLM